MSGAITEKQVDAALAAFFSQIDPKWPVGQPLGLALAAKRGMRLALEAAAREASPDLRLVAAEEPEALLARLEGRVQ